MLSEAIVQKHQYLLLEHISIHCTQNFLSGLVLCITGQTGLTIWYQRHCEKIKTVLGW